MIAMKITKPDTRPTVPLEPTTKVANALIMRPLKRIPWVRISLVEDMFSARPKMVTSKRNVGKRLKSVGRLLSRTIRSIKSEITRFMAISPSRITVGRGIISIASTTTTARPIRLPLKPPLGSSLRRLFRLHPFMAAPCAFTLALATSAIFNLFY